MPTIHAKVTFLSREKGGKSVTPGLSTGQYMPHLVIQSADIRKVKYIPGTKTCAEDYLGVRFIKASKEFAFDQPLDCEMELMYHPQVDYDAVRPGATFTIREGGQIVGFGVVSSRTE